MNYSFAKKTLAFAFLIITSFKLASQNINVIPKFDQTGIVNSSITMPEYYHNKIFSDYLKWDGTVPNTRLAFCEDTSASLKLIENPDSRFSPSAHFLEYKNNLFFSSTYAVSEYFQSTVLSYYDDTVIRNIVHNTYENIHCRTPLMIYKDKLITLYESMVNSSQGTLVLAEYDGNFLKFIPNPDKGPGFNIANGNFSPIIYKDKLLFTYTNNAGISQLAEYDGSSINLIANPTGYQYPTTLGLYKSKIYFTYYEANMSTQIRHLATYDGENVEVLPITGNLLFTTSDGIGLNHEELVIFNNKLVIETDYKKTFSSFDGSTVAPMPSPPANISVVNPRIQYNNKLYFSGFINNDNGDLIEFDGTSFKGVPNPKNVGYYAGTVLQFVTIFNNKLYFIYDNSPVYDANQIGEYDGTTVKLIKNPDNGRGVFGPFKQAGNRLYFSYQSTDNSGYSTLAYLQGDAVLAVKLLNFTANLHDNHSVKLEWQTINEVNNSQYNIQRSVNGTNFTTIRNIKSAAGVNGTNKDYLFNDDISAIPERNPTIYYRIEQLDIDGKKTYSDIREVSIRYKGESISLNPNPVRDVLNIDFAAGLKKASINLIDVNGKLLKTIKQNITGQTRLQISISELAAGVYFISIISDNNKSYYKFIKN